MITRKIPFTLIFALLLSPIVVAENLVGAVVKKSPETFLVETAGKEAAKLLLGKAADSIFGNEMDKMQDALTDKMDTMEGNIIGAIESQTQTILKGVSESTLTTHTNALGLGKDKLKAAINGVERDLKETKASAFKSYHDELQLVLDASDTYSQALDHDINIGTPLKQQWNGFWRSFVPYVSNKAIYASYIIERWQAEIRADWVKNNEQRAITVVKSNMNDLEAIYKHLEINVPTMPISDGGHLETHPPIQQNLNCVIRTDPDTQLVTSKGEFIRRYAGYDDVADHLPSAANVWRMWGYCRGDKSNQPPAYYGWANTNYEWAAGKHVGPTDDINECRQISTFGRCQASGFKYGCTMTPNSDPRHNQSRQGPRPDYYDNSEATNEIDNKRGRTWYTKFLWHEEPMVLAGTPADFQCFDKCHTQIWNKSSLTGQGTFVNYLRAWENTVCAMGPDGKQLSQEFPNAPALPHLPTKDLTSTPDSYPKNIIDSLPLTVIKTKTPTVEWLTDEKHITSAAYYFIKRNNTTKTAELSKPYQSALSAAHDRSLHYFTEFEDEQLPSAYCQIASIVSLNDSLLNALKANPGNVDQKLVNKAAIISYKLGITKENAANCFHEAKSNHIVASLHDQMTRTIQVSDHFIRSCLKYASYQKHYAQKLQPGIKIQYGNENLNELSQLRAACDAHFWKPPNIKKIKCKDRVKRHHKYDSKEIQQQSYNKCMASLDT